MLVDAQHNWAGAAAFIVLEEAGFTHDDRTVLLSPQAEGEPRPAGGRHRKPVARRCANPAVLLFYTLTRADPQDTSWGSLAKRPPW